MAQPEGLQPELAKLSRAARQYVLELGVQCAEQQSEIERLTRGINELDHIERVNQCYLMIDDFDGRWYMCNPVGECNDDRHADTLLELVRKLGGSTDDQREASDGP